MWVGPKNASQLSYEMTVQVWSLIRFCQKIPQFRFILKIILFSVWVPNSEERKANLRKSYLRVLVSIVKSLYSKSSAPVSGLASTYARSGSVSISASGSESTISPIILNLINHSLVLTQFNL
jgi:hypothetical protein